jgi:uncharacterized protein involved in exopolysaccharide biosynthesis
MTDSDGQDAKPQITSEPTGQAADSPGKRLQTAQNPLIFFLSSLCGLCLAVTRSIMRGLWSNAWIILTFLILSAVAGILLNAYLEKTESAYTASGVVQIQLKQSADPLHPAAPEDMEVVKLEMQSDIARFHDDNLIDDLLKDRTCPLRQTKWWTDTCANDAEVARNLLKENLVVEPVAGSTLMKVSFTAPEKADSAVIVTAVVDQTMRSQREYTRDSFDAQRRQTAEFKNRYEIELRNAQADVAAERTELIQLGASPFGAPGGPTEMELAARMKERIELQSAKVDIDAADAALKEMHQKGKVPPEVKRMVDQDRDIIHAREMLEDFDVRLLADAPGAASQPVVTLRELWLHKLDELEAKKLAESQTAYADQIADEKKNLAIKLDHCNSEIARLQAEIADIASKTTALKSREQDMQDYRDQVKAYDQHLLSLDQAARGDRVGGMDWFARPHVPSHRTFPVLGNIMAMAILCGLALGLITAVIRELVKWGRG